MMLQVIKHHNLFINILWYINMIHSVHNNLSHLINRNILLYHKWLHLSQVNIIINNNHNIITIIIHNSKLTLNKVVVVVVIITYIQIMVVDLNMKVIIVVKKCNISNLLKNSNLSLTHHITSNSNNNHIIINLIQVTP
eukprot:UN09846